MFRQPLPKAVLRLALLSLLAIVAISFMKAAPELEDAEQAYYTQWCRLGYNDQPPLFTWIQLLVNTVFGVNTFSFALLRGLIFGGIIVAVYQWGRNVLGKEIHGAMAVFALALVPVFIDFTFRRLSHTALLCLLVVLTYSCVLRLLRQRDIWGYVCLGLAMGCGMLVKYNYLLVIGALGMTALWDSEGRRVLGNWRIAISLVLVLLLIGPHIYWLYGHEAYQDVMQQRLAEKLADGSPKPFSIWVPPLRLATTFLQLVLPLALVLGVAYWKKWLQWRPASRHSWLVKALVCQMGVLLLAFWILQVQKVEARWLLPLFLPFVVFIPTFVRWKEGVPWERFGFGVFVALIVIQTLRTPAEKVLGIPSSVHFSFQPVVDRLLEYPERKWVVPDVTYGGNVRLLQPDRNVLAFDDFSLSERLWEGGAKVWTLTKGQQDYVRDSWELVDSIPGFGMERDTLYLYLD